MNTDDIVFSIKEHDLPPETKDKLRGISKEQIFTSIARLSATGEVSASAIKCMVLQTDLYFSTGRSEFNFDEWLSTYHECVRSSAEPKFINARYGPHILAFEAGFLLGVFIANEYL